MPLEINALESKRFGIVAARATDAGVDLAALKVAAEASGVQLLTIRVDCGENERIHALEGDGFRLMDTLVYHERTLDAPPPPLPANEGLVRRARPEDAAAVGDVARAAFTDYLGHYHADPRLPSEQADAAYVEWAVNSVANQSDTAPVLLHFHRERLGGFLTLKRESADLVEIPLNAVHPDLQRQGIYRRLLTEAILTAQAMGAARIMISTQVNNHAVQRIWARLGFLPVRSQHTFHKWYF